MFDAMPPNCKIDNWGLPKQTKRTFNGHYDQSIRIPCESQWTNNEKPFSDAHKQATALHYKDTHAYDIFEATDWVPENKHLFYPGAAWGSPALTDFTTKKPKSFLASECQIKQDDGSEWDITRIGPIRSTGGYDWLQIGWDDLWGLEEKLKVHKNGVYVVEQIISPVWPNGTLIDHPPIHIHHMHIGPAPYVRQRFNQKTCILEGKGCFDPSRTMEHHGDYNCMDPDGGLECRVETFPGNQESSI